MHKYNYEIQSYFPASSYPEGSPKGVKKGEVTGDTSTEEGVRELFKALFEHSFGEGHSDWTQEQEQAGYFQTFINGSEFEDAFLIGDVVYNVILKPGKEEKPKEQPEVKRISKLRF